LTTLGWQLLERLREQLTDMFFPFQRCAMSLSLFLDYRTQPRQGSRRCNVLTVTVRPKSGLATPCLRLRLVDHRSPVPRRSSLVTFRSTTSEPFWSHFS
jgi:hypothetical protein